MPDWLDGGIAPVLVLLAPVAAFVVISGLDDLVVAAVFLFAQRATDQTGGEDGAEKRMAVFVPLWREDGVIGTMIERNLAALRYRRVDFFLGTYPNDPATTEAVRDLAARFANVHLVTCPHGGPTSKADCLNWIYEGMREFERRRAARFEVVVTHDAEDLMHPRSLDCINRYTSHYDMVQIPVLPLPTPWWRLTHGVYCDEFAEYQTKDIPARQALGGFLPSNGVGTGYRREVLDKLAAAQAGRVFDPECLTEDYENGLRLHRLGCRQLFVRLSLRDGAPVATREYFPRRFRQAVRQRTRWVLGIALQGWQRHGWRGGARQVFWLWRDRKGLAGSLLSALANLLSAAVAGVWLASALSGRTFPLAALAESAAVRRCFWVAAALMLIQTALRAACVYRLYGWKMAATAPLRVWWANALNATAVTMAIRRYLLHRLTGEPLRWGKTEHAYPSRAALKPAHRPLGQILVEGGWISQWGLQAALASKPEGARLGEHLLSLGLISEEDLYTALSLQLGIPLGWVEPSEVPPEVARSLPAHLVREWKVLPFKVVAGDLLVAAAESPAAETERAIRRCTPLRIRFQLVTRENFELLERELLGR